MGQLIGHYVRKESDRTNQYVKNFLQFESPT